MPFVLPSATGAWPDMAFGSKLATMPLQRWALRERNYYCESGQGSTKIIFLFDQRQLF